jgi:hypothetical protein
MRGSGDERRGGRRVWWEVWLPLLLTGVALVGLNLMLYLKLAPAAP